jgi:hypothetical protein
VDLDPGLSPLGLPALSAHRAGLAPLLAMPPVHDDVNPSQSGHRSDEVIVQTLIAELDHDQEPEIGHWSRAHLRQEVRQVCLAESVRFSWIVQRLTLAEIRR